MKIRTDVKCKKKRNGLINLPKSRVERVELLYQLYIEQYKIDKVQAVNRVQTLTGLGRSSLYKFRKTYKWDERRINEIVKSESNAQLMQAAYSIQADKDKDLMERYGNVKFKDITTVLKGFAFRMLSSANKIGEISAQMIDFHAYKITQLIAIAGALDKMDAYEMQQINYHTKELAIHKNNIKEFINPNAMTKFFQLAGIEESMSIVPDDVNEMDFTPKAVQQLLIDSGLLGIVGNVDQLEALEGEIIDCEVIDARVVVDEVNSPTKKERFKRVVLDKKAKNPKTKK